MFADHLLSLLHRMSVLFVCIIGQLLSVCLYAGIYLNYFYVFLYYFNSAWLADSLFPSICLLRSCSRLMEISRVLFTACSSTHPTSLKTSCSPNASRPRASAPPTSTTSQRCSVRYHPQSETVVYWWQIFKQLKIWFEFNSGHRNAITKYLMHLSLSTTVLGCNKSDWLLIGSVNL